jgi:AcrR family transcriptional regulator
MTEVTSGADDVRERILDAATECIVESGIDARLHATIAERAGVSRPTVYKYVGDQTAILSAVLDREIERFFAAATPVFTAMNQDESRGLDDAIVFVVDYARRHTLLQMALHRYPGLILPALTTNSAGLIEGVVAAFSEHVDQRLARSGGEGNTRAIVEWAFRIAVSLVITPSASTQDDASLRRHLAELSPLIDLLGQRAPSR